MTFAEVDDSCQCEACTESRAAIAAKSAAPSEAPREVTATADVQTGTPVATTEVPAVADPPAEAVVAEASTAAPFEPWRLPPHLFPPGQRAPGAA
jgi:hypothetical protein